MGTWPALNIPSPGSLTTELAEQLQISPVVAQLLINRGIDIAEARAMLEPEPVLDWPVPDFTQRLQQRFLSLAADHQRIAIFGDYDADGLSGTSVLNAFLKGAGFEVTPVLPTRSQGYGLNIATLESLYDAGVGLVITVDCGISNAPEIEHAQNLGLQVIVTDHHGLPTVLPEADFILHPAVLDIPELANLSGAGMAYWLTTLLAPVFPQAPAPESLLDLAVLGTLADMTPLRGLNFALAKRGLQAARKTQRPGLLALAELKNVEVSQLTEDDLTFRMIPMLNAAGRIDSPLPALELLMASQPEEAKRLALALQELNTLRQQYCEQVLESALEKIETGPDSNVIVMADAQWPHGVLGITCSQLVERYHKPVALMAIEGPYAKASVRAPKGYHVLEALQACASYLVRFGGHEMAGGYTIETEQIPAFSQAFGEICYQQQQNPQPQLQVEMEINPELLDIATWQAIRQLAPFGMANPSPLFLSLNVELQQLKADRKSGQHLFGQLGNQTRIKGWRMWDSSYEQHSHFDLIFRPELESWKGKTSLSLTLQKIRPHQLLKRSQPASAAQPLKQSAQVSQQIQPLPGVFFDGEQWWQLLPESRPVSVQWQDMRHLQPDVIPASAVRYAPALPEEAPLQQAPASRFQTLLLEQPPPLTAAAELCQSFAEVCIWPLQPLSPLPDFRQLARLLQLLQQENITPSGPSELCQWAALTPAQAEIAWSSLCDLGLLAYDNERYRVQYKNQRYDLRQSESFERALRCWQARNTLAQQWQLISCERLKNALLAQER